MQPARIIGHTHATQKHPSLDGQRLVIAQPTGPGEASDGPPLLVLDQLGCDHGDRVMLTSDGSYVQSIAGTNTCPARWCVCGLIDD
ncbi:MAG: EutN/CcmL family microcompartment protein [Planctomycetota bacterium]